MISLKYSRYLKSLSEHLKNNPKKFWSLHSLKSKTWRIPPVVTYKLKSASTPAQRASLFNEFFSSVFTSTSADHLTLRNDVIHPDLVMSVSTSALEVQKILAKLDANKATGADNIPARILKECFRELVHPLSILFNLSFRLGVVPQKWKRANITPVFKSDNKNLVEIYRSVFLLSVISKCQENILYHAIFSQVASYLNDWQHGFIKGRSCVTQLVLTHHYWSKALDAGHQVDAVFLDFSKAFDKVSLPCYFNAKMLCNFGVCGCLLNWCRDFLLNREQRVVIDGKSSDWRPIPSGAPQGSLLGRLFFVIFINDLPDVLSLASFVSLYADDCKTSRVIQHPCDHESLHDDLNILVSWSRLNHMSFNTKKCKLMRITKNRSPIFAPLQLGGTILEVTAEFSDLCFLTNHKLSWNSHLDKISSKANKVVGLIKRNCREFRDVLTLRTLYCALNRSQLEYGSVVWSPFTARNITKLERVQRRTTKFILKTENDYEVCISKLNLLSLEHRRFLFYVIFFYKALN